MIMRYRLVRFAAGAVLAILSGLTPSYSQTPQIAGVEPG
jgi:hypothetical protein